MTQVTLRPRCDGPGGTINLTLCDNPGYNGIERCARSRRNPRAAIARAAVDGGEGSADHRLIDARESACGNLVVGVEILAACEARRAVPPVEVNEPPMKACPFASSASALGSAGTA